MAVLAEKFGADAAMDDVLEAISAACPKTREKHPGRGVRPICPDLVDPKPPDLPRAAGSRLRLIVGERGQLRPCL